MCSLKVGGKISGKGAAQGRNRIYFISNEDMNDIEILKSLED